MAPVCVLWSVGMSVCCVRSKFSFKFYMDSLLHGFFLVKVYFLDLSESFY